MLVIIQPADMMQYAGNTQSEFGTISIFCQLEYFALYFMILFGENSVVIWQIQL